MTQRKKLIEVALPLEAINEASAREKSIRHGHPSTLHLWWARRPLAACRAVIFSSLVDDPDSPDAPPEFVRACRALDKGPNATVKDTPRMRLFDFIETLVRWESTIDEKVIGKARELIRLCTGGNPPPLLDPFAGGGSIPLEAQRLGLEAHASDLNPVAVMINKALIEIPPRFAGRSPVNPRDRARMASGEGWKGAAGLAADVRYYGEWMREEAFKRIGHLYPKHNGETVIAWLWARTVTCPNPACGCQMPLVRSFELSIKAGRRAWVMPQTSRPSKDITYVVETGSGKAPKGTINRSGARCICCNTPVPLDYIRSEGKEGRMNAQLLAIVTEGQNGRSYYSPTAEHVNTANTSLPKWVPDIPINNNPRDIRPQLYGLMSYADLFTARQLVALSTFSDLVTEAREQCYHDAMTEVRITDGLYDDVPLREKGAGVRAYAEAVSIYLNFGISKAASRNCTLAIWETGMDRLAGGFSRQAIPMTWDYAESNPLAGAGGDIAGTVASVAEVLEKLPMNDLLKLYTAVQQDATTLENVGPVISTDPPYYDNIDYADLSDFFYIWLRHGLRDLFPEVFSTLLVPKANELVAMPHRFGGDKDAANRFFEEGLRKTFVAMRRSIYREYPITIYYAFRQMEDDDVSEDETTTVVSTGWEAMLSGLIESGFEINGTWPIRTELLTALKKTVNALASSVVLVCWPRPVNASIVSRRQFMDLLRRELPTALKELQSGNIAPVDLAQASIGPGMAVYSRYSKVLEADGSPLSVRTALGLINQELDAYLAEQDGDIDPDTRFAVAWFEQYGFDEGEFGVADVLARAKATSVEGVQRAGVVASGRGKVRLVEWKEYDPGAWDPQTDRRLTVWEATLHLIERLNNHGEQGAGMLLAKLNVDVAAEARNLAYRLYNICERKGWADYARDYNALVVQWAGIQEQAKEAAQNLTQDKLI